MLTCIKNSMESLKPLLKDGNIAPGFHIERECNFYNATKTLKIFFLQALDPLFLGDVMLNEAFGLNLSEIQVFGLSKFNIDKIRFNAKKMTVSCLVIIKFQIILILFPMKFGITLMIPSSSTTSKYSLIMTQGFQIQASGDASSQLGKWWTHFIIRGAPKLATIGANPVLGLWAWSPVLLGLGHVWL